MQNKGFVRSFSGDTYIRIEKLSVKGIVLKIAPAAPERFADEWSVATMNHEE